MKQYKKKIAMSAKISFISRPILDSSVLQISNSDVSRKSFLNIR